MSLTAAAPVGQVLPDDGAASLDKQEAPLHPLDGVEPQQSHCRPVGSSLNDQVPQLPWCQKAPILLSLLFLTLGSNWASSTIGPLKSTLKQELNISNSQYGVIAGAHSLVNSVWPLVAGVLTDHYGPGVGTFASSVCVFIGSLVTALGSSLVSYPAITVGQIVFGFGNMALETAQSTSYAHFCRGTMSGGPGQLAFVNGLDIGLGRVFGVGGAVSAIPILHRTGSWAWPFWVACILCAFTLVLNVGFLVLERQLPRHARIVSGRRLAAHSVYTGLLALPASFWLLAVSQMLQAGVVQAYLSNQADMVKVTRSSTALEAGYTSSLSQVIPIVLTPLLGLFFDRFGKRMHFVSITAATWVVVFALLGFSRCHPLLPTILGSVGLSLNVLPFLASIPLLLTSDGHVATAYGVWKSFNSAGTTVVDIAVGALQDGTVAGDALSRSTTQYDHVFYLFLALKAADFFYGLVYHQVDHRYLGGVLCNSERQRLTAERCATPANRINGIRRPIRAVTFFGICAEVSLVILAYVIYIYYAS